MSEVDEERTQALLQEIAGSLRELVTWTRIIGYPTVKQMLETVLDSNEKRLVYHLTDGRRSVAEVQKLTGVNARFISEVLSIAIVIWSWASGFTVRVSHLDRLRLTALCARHGQLPGHGSSRQYAVSDSCLQMER